MLEKEAAKNRLGIQILFDFSDVIDAIDFAASNRFRVLEINLGNIKFREQLRRAVQRRRIRKWAQRSGVVLTVHALEGPSFFIPSDRVRNCAIKELKQTLDWAGELCAKNVIMHLGFDMHYGFGGGNRFTHEEFPDYYQAALLFALSELKGYARARTRLCVENVGGFRFALTRKVLNKIIGGSLGLCFDIGHISILSKDKRQEEFQFFRRFQKSIYHAHLHHNNGTKDQHLPLGEGTTEILPYLKLIFKSQALMVFETRPKEAALRSRDCFEQMYLPKLL